MKPDLKPFVDALRQRDIRGAKENSEKIIGQLDLNDEFWRGYSLALKGMVNALESVGELTVIRRLVEGKYSREQIRRLIRDARTRISQDFRPADERGFEKVWIEVLQMF